MSSASREIATHWNKLAADNVYMCAYRRHTENNFKYEKEQKQNLTAPISSEISLSFYAALLGGRDFCVGSPACAKVALRQPATLIVCCREPFSQPKTYLGSLRAGRSLYCRCAKARLADIRQWATQKGLGNGEHSEMRREYGDVQTANVDASLSFRASETCPFHLKSSSIIK